MRNEVAEHRGRGEGMGRSSFGKQTFRSFKNPAYRLYYGGMLGQMAPSMSTVPEHVFFVWKLIVATGRPAPGP